MRYTLKGMMKLGGIALACGFIIGYSLFQAHSLMEGPVVHVSVPSRSANDVADISGIARNIAYITFNGKQIFTDTDGNFNQKFVLSPGYNVVTVAATDKFGRTSQKTVELVYKESTGPNGNSLTMITTNSNGKAN
jgi:hypothetical protein